MTVAESGLVNAVLTFADWAPPLVAAMLATAAALTVTERLPVCVPLLTVTVAASALYSVMTPLLEPDTVATPLVKVIAVVEPNAIAVPELFVTVGLFAPIEPAPLKVRFLLPA